MMERRLIHVQRDCPARLVPVGTPITVPAGTFVTLTQSLGGSYTVVFNGNMARIDGRDGDALGFTPTEYHFEPAADGRIDPDHVWDALRTVYDPEIPVNIVDLGLIYDVDVTTVGNRQRVDIEMTLTAPGCGMGPVLVDEIKERLRLVPFVDEVCVELVFDPPWSRDRMTEEAQLELGLF
jgi:probable FeS assembly SUF system protein SufT